MTQQYPGHYRPGSTGIYQHGTGTQYAGSDGVYQQSTSGYLGESAGTPNRYAMQNIGEDHQNRSGIYNANTNAGTYQNMSNEPQSGMMDSQVSNDYKAGGESVEAAESRQYSGTVEELDGFCKEGKLKEVVELLGLLEGKHIPVDLPRYLMLMKACGEAKALQEAKYVHEHLMRSVSIPEVSTYNRILEMYGKCGSMDDAFTVFDKMPRRNLTSWDTMITWLANNGHGEDAIELFTQFKKAGLKPDGEMFFRVFSACSVLGDVIEGMLHFDSMRKDYGIVPLMEHYVSVVDMLGSAGYLDEALEFVEKMPVEPSVEVWETLMNLGRVHGNTEIGDRCAELVELMDPSRLNEQSKSGLIQVKAPDLAKEKEKKKLANENLLAVRSRVHEYRAGDRSHPENDRIYAQLRGMREQMKEAGYVAETRFVLHDIDQEGKEEALLAHSERLAVAYGFLTTPARAQIRIIKNLRVCGDCHSALKIISKLVGRELIIRDAKSHHLPPPLTTHLLPPLTIHLPPNTSHHPPPFSTIVFRNHHPSLLTTHLPPPLTTHLPPNTSHHPLPFSTIVYRHHYPTATYSPPPPTPRRRHYHHHPPPTCHHHPPPVTTSHPPPPPTCYHSPPSPTHPPTITTCHHAPATTTHHPSPPPPPPTRYHPLPVTVTHPPTHPPTTTYHLSATTRYPSPTCHHYLLPTTRHHHHPPPATVTHPPPTRHHPPSPLFTTVFRRHLPSLVISHSFLYF
ncbi:hypothetical protein HYC85_027456 [Camellia sinensis]|uniref:DYW domain-containing protein n=1 Tax=Camellia sinensis TaxID=4442 RepID=A0A7J7G6T5_CAMSI|nr:hypothetical protein HYC85_027456 [Camellia sinensis]